MCVFVLIVFNALDLVRIMLFVSIKRATVVIRGEDDMGGIK